MTDTNRLRLIIAKSGLKYKFIAKKLGLTYFGLQKKITNANEFKASEIYELCKVLEIDSKVKDEIFFANSVE